MLMYIETGLSLGVFPGLRVQEDCLEDDHA